VDSATPPDTLPPELRALAARLWAARRDGGTIDAGTVHLPSDLLEAYAVQAEALRLCGAPLRAYKVGSTSPEAQRKLGTTEPGACPVPATFLLDSPAALDIDPVQMPAVEGEFAFRIGRDLPARPAAYERDEVMAAVDAVAGAIEVVGCRFADGLDGKGRLLVTADFGANIALLLGEPRPVTQKADFRDHAVELFANGASKARGTGARALGGPVNVLVWLAGHLAARGSGLTAGTWVATGTCTGLLPVAPGDEVNVDFGPLGRVHAAFRQR